MRRVVDWPFLLLTSLLTALCFSALVRHVEGATGWVLFGVSIIPVYATIYQAVLFGKALLHSRWSPPLREPGAPSGERPGVAFVIASYQEPFEVAKMTFDCARDIEYSGPREIIVVDNSHDVASENYRRWKAYVESHAGTDPRLRVVFAYNEKKGGLKPGNVDLAQTLIGPSKYIVLLDVDSSLPLRGGLLDRAVAELEADEKLGVLQFHTTPTNDHFNALTGPVAVAQNALRLKHLLRGDGGFAMFYGHNAIWRRSLADALGPWLEHYRGNVMVTEDLLKSVGAYTRGYTSRYVDIPTGEWIPSSLDALETMWKRWAYGGFQVLFKYFGSVLATPNLTLLERIDLLTFMGSYGAAPLFYPISLLWFFVFPPARAGALTFAILLGPPLITALLVRRRYTSELSVSRTKKLWDLYAGLFLIDAFILIVSLKGVSNFLAGVNQGWRVTAKDVEARPSWPQVLARHRHVVGLAAAALVALVAAWGIHTDFAPAQSVRYLAPAFVSLNLILCVALYGREGRHAGDHIEGTTIDGYAFRNQVLVQVPLFHGTNALFQHGLALVLKPRACAAGEVIVAKGELGQEMFFVARGEVELTDGERLLSTMGAGSFFGERALILEEPRAATARTRGACDLFVLDKADFLKALREQPKVARTLAIQARKQYGLQMPAESISKLAS